MYIIIIMCADADAGDCMRTPISESGMKVDSGRRIPCRTGKSKLRQYCSCGFGPDGLPTGLFRCLRLKCVIMHNLHVLQRRQMLR